MNKFLRTILKYPQATLLLIAVTIRLFFVLIYQHITVFPDAGYYRDLAGYLMSGTLKGYTGERTPGYPLLIAFANGNLIYMVLMQLIMGVLSTLLVYDITFAISRSIKNSLFTALLYTSFLTVIFYEFAILTETLSIFLLHAIIWLVIRFKLLEVNVKLSRYIILSTLCAMLFLTRPMFIYIPILFSVFYVVRNFKAKYMRTFIIVFISCLGTLASQIWWQDVNFKNTGYRQNTYFMGFNLIQTATPFLEKIPDKDAVIRNILLKHRKIVMLEKSESHYPMTVWYAQNELLQTTGLSNPDLAARFKDISIDLFKNHPLEYLKQVSNSFALFWGTKSTFIWNQQAVTSRSLQLAIMGTLTFIQMPLLLLLNLVFIGISLRVLVKVVRNRLFNLTVIDFIISVVMAAACAQALVAYGDNSRFAFPFLGLIIVVTMHYASHILIFKKKMTD